jgi:NAD(P)-dependent dehydrogenase (short-subunit alcohol dehydrogenase family)
MAEPQKSIFVTGAGSGIGRATAKLFADRGWFVGLFDVNQQGLDETAAMLPEGQRISMTFDVRDRAGWARAVETFGQATNRRMHVLFNNAGIGRGGPIDEMPGDDIDLVLDVNLKRRHQRRERGAAAAARNARRAHRQHRIGRRRVRRAEHGRLLRDEVRRARPH